ncbi:MAG: hypothetical protein J6P31_03170 [Oscillospiraceae bacterium]|nr:hypothetical protein [Oscillospiraceae bacterium]
MAKKKPVAVPASSNDDSVVYKVMAALIAACIEVLVTQRVCKVYDTFEKMDVVKHALGIAGIVLAVLSAAALAAAIILRRKPKAVFPVVLTFVNLVMCCAAAFVLYHFWTGPAIILYFVYFALAVLVAVYYLYQPEFFLLTIECMTAAFGFYCLSQTIQSSLKLSILVGICMAVVFLLVGGLAFSASKKHGYLKLKGTKIRVLRHESPLILYITSLVWLLCLIAASVFGSFFSYLCVFAAIAWAFVFAIYYTIKLK